jgi:hypothetical protein
MKKRTDVIFTIISMIVALLISTGWNNVLAQAKPESLKLGTYDSRIVTLAYSRSEHFAKVMNEMKESEAIMLSNDTVKMMETIYKIFTRQYILHQQVFSTGSSAYVLDLVKDKLPQVAKDADVFAIVNKWELTFIAPNIKLVDLTMPVSKLFNPSGDFDKMVPGMQNQAPIPIEEFTVEEVVQMWKQYEAKYLGKKK